MGDDRFGPSSYQRGPEFLVGIGREIPKPVDSASGPQNPELPALHMVQDQVLREPRLMGLCCGEIAPLIRGDLEKEPVVRTAAH